MGDTTRYDVAVIGAGIAGLITANYFAKAGKRTVLIEQNHQPGGLMSGFRRKGFTFDGGDQSFESMGIVFPILDELGLYREEDWRKARFRFVSGDFDFCIDSIDTAENALRTAFPNEPGLKPLFDDVREVSRFIDTVCTPNSFPLLHNFGIRPLLEVGRWAPRVRRWLTFRDRERMCSVIENPALRNWFTQIGYRRMTYLFFAGFWHLWANDYWYHTGGMQAFVDRLAGRFTEQGGVLRCKTVVSALRTEGKQVSLIELSDGESVGAETVVYCGDYNELLSRLLPDEVVSTRFAKRVRGSRLTEPLVSVYLGLADPPERTAEIMKAQHVFVFPNYDVVFPNAQSPRDIHRRMWVTASFTGDHDPGLAPPGKSAVVLQTFSSYGWQNKWESGGSALPRTDAYRDLKRTVGLELVETAERIYPGLGDRVEYLEVGSPLSARRFTMNTEGSSGGWSYDDRASPVYRRWAKNLFRTPLANLYTAGHYTLWPGGVISAVLSGRLVSNMVLGKRALTRMRD